MFYIYYSCVKSPNKTHFLPEIKKNLTPRDPQFIICICFILLRFFVQIFHLVETE